MLSSCCHYSRAVIIVLAAAVASFGVAWQPAAADEPGETISDSIDMKMKLIPSGEFQMGGESYAEFVKAVGFREDFHPQMFDDEQPKHRVRITKSFYLGIYEVTREQFSRFVKAENYRTEAEQDGKGGWGWDKNQKRFLQKPEYTWRDWGVRDWGANEPPSSPVVNLSWNDAVAFCKWLSHKEDKAYRLPTEAEWEYACRAGTTTRYYNGDDPNRVPEIGNFDDGWLGDWNKPAEVYYAPWKFEVSRSRDGYAFTAPVGQFRPNRFGLYDMVGNAAEWCSDWYSHDYYARSPTDDPQGPAAGKYRVIRGGGWYRGDALFVYSGNRRAGNPERLPLCAVGFRVLRER